MPSRLPAAALVLVVFCSGLPARAALIASEDFGYALGELVGQAGGSGFSGAWGGVTAATQVVNPGAPLAFVVSGGATIDGGDRALALSGNSDNLLFRDLTSSVSADEVFLSFLLRVDAGSLQDNDFAVLWHDAASGGAHTTVPNVGLKANRGDGSGPEDFLARPQLAGGTSVYSTAAGVGQTYLVVARIFKSVPGAASQYDRVSLWVDPAYADAGSPDATATHTASLASFDTLGMRGANLDAGDVILIDALRYGTTWDDVVPAAPEPTLAPLAGLVLAAVAARIRTRPRR